MIESPAKDQLEGQLIGGYRLGARIGSGGMSVVYLADEITTGKQLAIKFLRSAFTNLPGFVRRFEQEARACRRLENDNCVSILDFGVAFGSPYLAMEYVDGDVLTKTVSAGPMAARRAIRIIRQVLEGLSHAHGRGVVHRDLKPGNIMLTEVDEEKDFVKILDFGTAQILTSEPGAIGGGGTDIGTPWYMAPEQAAAQATDPRTDLYSVGVITFELLTGARPFIADDPMRVAQMHISSPIPSVRVLCPDAGISPELEAAIVRAMQKQPADRFSDAASFDEALKDVPEVKPRRPTSELAPVRRRRMTASVVRPPTASTLMAPEPKRSPWPLIVAGVAALVAAAIALLVFL